MNRPILPTHRIHCQGLSVELSGRQILDRIDFDVEPGTIVSLLGASGCGKSTLLRAISGLLSPTEGTVEIASEHSDVQTNVINEPSGISFVFQEPTLLPWRSARENVQLPLELHGKWDRSSADKIRQTLLDVGLNEADHMKTPRQLSGGMRMRVSLARALVTDPDILLLDEPFAALDDMLRTRLNALLLELQTHRPRTIVFVTHNISEAIFLSDRIALMGKGKIQEWIPISLPEPRKSDVRGTAEFAELYGKVAKRLEEVAR